MVEIKFHQVIIFLFNVLNTLIYVLVFGILYSRREVNISSYKFMFILFISVYKQKSFFGANFGRKKKIFQYFNTKIY